MRYIEIERELEKYRNCIESFVKLMKIYEELNYEFDQITGNEENVKNAKKEIEEMYFKVKNLIYIFENDAKKIADILIPPQPPVLTKYLSEKE